MMNDEQFNEALITFGNKSEKYNNVVILAGGAASVKGFIAQNLFDIEGRTFDVDHLKDLAIRSKTLQVKYPQLKSMDLSNPDDLASLHNIASKEKLPEREFDALKNGIIGGTDYGYKPNLIFDVHLSGLDKLYYISNNVSDLGYRKDKRHLVWVIQDVEIAKQLSKAGDRNVPDEIVAIKHQGIAHSMSQIINILTDLTKYLDGDFWLVFNKPNVDTIELHSPNEPKTPSWKANKSAEPKTPFVIDKVFKFKIKSAGYPILDKNSIPTQLLDKIREYTQTDI